MSGGAIGFLNDKPAFCALNFPSSCCNQAFLGLVVASLVLTALPASAAEGESRTLLPDGTTLVLGGSAAGASTAGANLVSGGGAGDC